LDFYPETNKGVVIEQEAVEQSHDNAEEIESHDTNLEAKIVSTREKPYECTICNLKEL